MVACSDCRYGLGMQALARAQLVPELEKSHIVKSTPVVPAVSKTDPSNLCNLGSGKPALAEVHICGLLGMQCML